MQKPKKILIISYLFPPAGGIAVQRALSFARYLPTFGYEVHVLYARNAAAPVVDRSLVQYIPAATKLHGIFAPEIPFGFRQKAWRLLSRGGTKQHNKRNASGKSAESFPARLIKRILCPEPEILWAPFAVRRAADIIHKYEIETVLVTVPPFSLLVVGERLKKLIPEIKLVSDFRDEWLTFYLNHIDTQSGDFTRRRAERIERRAVEASDLVIAVTPSSIEEIRGRYREQPADKFAYVANGFDPEMFANFSPRKHSGKNVIVCHLGTVYSTATPRYYLDALERMPPQTRCNIETRFIGRISDNEKEVLEARKARVRVLGFMQQAPALKAIEDADYLLLNLADGLSIPGKLFEYLATGKPILAISPSNGEVARILKETGAGWCADPYIPGEIDGMLTHAFECVRIGQSGLTPDGQSIRRYERPRLARELANRIETARGGPSIS